MKFSACILGVVALVLSSTSVAASGLRSLEAESPIAIFLAHGAKQTSDDTPCSLAIEAESAKIDGFAEAAADVGMDKGKQEALICKYGSKQVAAAKKAKGLEVCADAGNQAIIDLSIQILEAIVDEADCGLGAGAIAGIVIGVLAIIGLVIFFVMRRKKQSSMSTQLA